MSRTDLSEKVVEVDESLREISALDELYDEITRSRPESRQELEIKKEEARFARERMLKLSLHVRNALATIESHEALK